MWGAELGGVVRIAQPFLDVAEPVAVVGMCPQAGIDLTPHRVHRRTVMMAAQLGNELTERFALTGNGLAAGAAFFQIGLADLFPEAGEQFFQPADDHGGAQGFALGIGGGVGHRQEVGADGQGIVDVELLIERPGAGVLGQVELDLLESFAVTVGENADTGRRPGQHAVVGADDVDAAHSAGPDPGDVAHNDLIQGGGNQGNPDGGESHQQRIAKIFQTHGFIAHGFDHLVQDLEQ
ncbi:hypothetical protein DSECCO2_656500 [anaerobic digester metagenome]